jgi:TetR/AcrR family transcriptional repressor of nem operon
MEKKVTKAERTRQFIIERTADIFNIKGYAGTSLSDLTSATGLTKGGIYANFTSKEDVALAAFDYNHAQIIKLLKRKIDSASSIQQQIMAYAEVYDQYFDSQFPKGGCPLLNTAIEADDTNATLKEKSSAAILKWKENLIRLIFEGIKTGEFNETQDAEQNALSMIALIEGGMMIAKATNNPAYMASVMKTFKLMTDGFLKSN